MSNARQKNSFLFKKITQKLRKKYNACFFYGTLISVIYILKSDDNVTLKDFEYD